MAYKSFVSSRKERVFINSDPDWTAAVLGVSGDEGMGSMNVMFHLNANDLVRLQAAIAEALTVMQPKEAA